jgi:hypothetical protein
VSLHTSEDVFRTCASILGGRVRRLPDGETGERADLTEDRAQELMQTGEGQVRF